jgi:DNA sulfur modification protein DndD
MESEMKLAEIEVQQAQENFMAQGGQIAQDSPQLQIKLQEIQNAIATQRQQLREFAAEELPLILIQPLLSAAHQQAHKEVRRKQVEMARDILVERDQRLLKILTDLNLRPKQSQTIQAFLTNENQILDREAETQENWLEADLATLNQLTHLLTRQIPNRSNQIRDHLKHLKDSEIEEESTERYLASAAPVEVYQQLKAAVAQAQSNLEAIHLRRATCEERLRGIERAIASSIFPELRLTAAEILTVME